MGMERDDVVMERKERGKVGKFIVYSRPRQVSRERVCSPRQPRKTHLLLSPRHKKGGQVQDKFICVILIHTANSKPQINFKYKHFYSLPPTVAANMSSSSKIQSH